MSVRGRPRQFDRNLALAKAMDVFWERGYEGASLTALTQAMSINPPSLYAAFESKEKLFYEALDYYLNYYGSYRIKALDSAVTAKEGVKALLLATIAQFYTDETVPKGCLVVLFSVSGAPESKDIEQVLTKERRETARLIEARIERGVIEGDVPNNVNSRILAELYTTVLFGLSIQAKDKAPYDDLVLVIDATMQAWP